MSQGEGGGRPPRWTDENREPAVIEICRRLASENSVVSICESDPENLPSRAEFYQWLAKYPKFQDIYAQAKANQTEFLLDEIPDIADDGRNDFMARDKDGALMYSIVNENIARSRLRVDARFKLAEKLSPRKYGPKQELTGPNGDGLFDGIKIQFVKGGSEPDVKPSAT